MIHVLLLLASLANAQEVSTGTSYTADQGNDQPFSLADQISISNQGKSIYNLLGGRPKITGQPRFTKGICFDAGGTNCQTAAYSTSYSCTQSSATFTGVTSYSLTGLSGGADYNIRFSYRQITLGATLTATINSDTGAVYSYASRRVNEAGAGADAGGSATTSFALSQGQSVSANSFGSGYIVLQSSATNSVSTGVNWQMWVGAGAASGNAVTGSGSYVSAAQSSLQLIFSAGTATGIIRWTECR